MIREPLTCYECGTEMVFRFEVIPAFPFTIKTQYVYACPKCGFRQLTFIPPHFDQQVAQPPDECVGDPRTVKNPEGWCDDDRD